jgi:hypothetical protein
LRLIENNLIYEWRCGGLIKPRIESKKLKRLKSLNARMRLSAEEANYYRYLDKGLGGEKKFDDMLKILPDDWLIISDLMLKYNNTEFQIDSLLIFHGTVLMIEVKNYEGDYIFEADRDRWCNVSKNDEIIVTRYCS